MEAKGRASGLCIMWKARVSIKVVEFDKNVIAVKVSDSVTDWLLVGFYGLPYYSKKKKAWGNLFALLESHQGPWACIGDFNYIMNEDEQVRGCEGSSSAINYLKELMFEYDAVNLGYSGNKFIWAKEHTNPDPSTPKWSSPPLGTIKINVDAATSSSNLALAVATKNSQGSVLNI
nr:hypothetical protein CFP56_54043 [Quercus suber]